MQQEVLESQQRSHFCPDKKKGTLCPLYLNKKKKEFNSGVRDIIIQPLKIEVSMICYK